MQGLVKRLWEEFDKCFVSEADFVNIVCPLNKQATPDHYTKDREIYPMKPAYGQ